MRALDTSVLVAAFASWHEAHDEALAAVPGSALVGHAVMETYSVLTRLPPPHRVSAHMAAAYLARLSRGMVLVPSPTLVAALPARMAAQGISGGATYDALIGATAAAAQASVVSLDARAVTTYRALGVEHVVLPSPHG